MWSRADLLSSLLDRLEPQLLPFAGQVTVLVDLDDAVAPVGVKRTRLIREARASYVSFVDDDDAVAPDYVASIMDALQHGPDQVGFQVRYLEDGVEQKPVYHTVHAGRWYEDKDGYWRDHSHLNPVWRPIALRGLPFRGGFGEDSEWADRVRESGLVRREVMIPRVMYEYRHNSATSLFGGGKRQTGEQPMLRGWRFVGFLATSGTGPSVEA